MSQGRKSGKQAAVVLVLGAWVLAFAAGKDALAADPPKAVGPALTVSIMDGRVSLEARDRPLQQVLDAIAERAGFALDIRGALAGNVWQSFDDLPIETAIRRIVGRNSFIMEYDDTPAANGARRVARLTVIGRGKSSRRAANSGRKASSSTIARGDADGRRKVREIHRLRRNKTPETARKLSDMLLRDKDRKVRETAASVLGGFKGQPVSGALMAALSDDEITVRRRAIIALGRVGGDGVVDTLIRILRSDSDSQGRRLAAQALARYPEARSALEDAAKDPDTRVSAAARSVLRRLDRRR